MPLIPDLLMMQVTP